MRSIPHSLRRFSINTAVFGIRNPPYGLLAYAMGLRSAFSFGHLFAPLLACAPEHCSRTPLGPCEIPLAVRKDIVKISAFPVGQEEKSYGRNVGPQSSCSSPESILASLARGSLSCS